MKIIGLSAYYHDSSAALIHDGKILYAAQEERFSRLKHDFRFPVMALNQCFKTTGVNPADVDAIVYYEKPFVKFERLMETYLAFAPKGFTSFRKALPIWLHEKLFQKKLLQDELLKFGFRKDVVQNLLFSEHHLSHAASAFYPSPFLESLILTVDGVGEWDTVAAYLGKDSTITKIREIKFPHSLGLLYSAFTLHCGFKVNSGEYKLMGLAPYGTPRFVEKIKTHLIDIKSDGSFKLNLKYFDYCTGLRMTNKHFNELFENSERSADQELKQIHMDLAASVQLVLEEVLLKMLVDLKKEYGSKNLCLAGGVALNCAANGKIHASGLFDQIYIQPAAGDAGGSLGAAWAAYYLHFKKTRAFTGADEMNGAFCGPNYDDDFIEETLKEEKIVFQKLDRHALIKKTAELLKEQKVIGVFQGRMEFGPRALGHRSILADSRSRHMQKNLNLKIKFRESFRPFAPILLAEDFNYWFDGPSMSSYMLFLAQLKHEHRILPDETEKHLFGIEKLNTVRSLIPAVTHVDYTSRVQTVTSRNDSWTYELLKEFKRITGISVLVNTSFNVRGEPIVALPRDAVHCFMGTEMDALVIGSYLALKDQQTQSTDSQYHKKFAQD